MTKTTLFLLAIFAGTNSVNAQTASTEAYGPAQAAADVLRAAAEVDAAFLPAGMLKDQHDSGNLASLLQYPTDELAVLSLRGSVVRQALERSISLYPSPSSAFLQLSNLEVTFSKSAAADKRIVAVRLGGAPLDDGRTYTVAMPGSLARGGLGYFKVWSNAPLRTVQAGRTLEDFLKGKPATPSAARWVAAP